MGPGSNSKPKLVAASAAGRLPCTQASVCSLRLAGTVISSSRLVSQTLQNPTPKLPVARAWPGRPVQVQVVSTLDRKQTPFLPHTCHGLRVGPGTLNQLLGASTRARARLRAHSQARLSLGWEQPRLQVRSQKFNLKLVSDSGSRAPTEAAEAHCQWQRLQPPPLPVRITRGQALRLRELWPGPERSSSQRGGPGSHLAQPQAERGPRLSRAAWA